MFTLYRVVFRATRKAIRYSINSAAQNWNKTFTHIEQRVGAVGRKGLFYKS